MRPMSRSQRRRTLLLIAGFAGLAALLGTIGAYAYLFHVRQFQIGNKGLMESILPFEDLRLDAWLKERTADLAFYAGSPPARDLVARLARSPSDAQARRRLAAWFDAARAAHPEYRAVSVLARDGRTLWASSGADSFGSPRDAAAAAWTQERVAFAPLQDVSGQAVALCALRSGPAVTVFHVDATNGILPSLGGLAPWPPGAFDLYLGRRAPEGAEVLDHDPARPGKLRSYRLPPTSAAAKALWSGALSSGADHFGKSVLVMPARKEFLGWRPLGVREFGHAAGDSRTLAFVFALLGAFGVAGAFLLMGRLVSSAEAENVRALLLSDSLMARAPDPIFLISREAVILEANPAAESFYGYAPGELVGKPVNVLRGPQESGQPAARVKETLERGAIRFEAAHVRKDGAPLSVEINACRLELEDRRIVQAIVRDVTESKAHLNTIERLGLLYKILADCSMVTASPKSRAGLFEDLIDVLKPLPGLATVSIVRPDEARRALLLETGYPDELVRRACAEVPFSEDGTGSPVQRCHYHRRLVADGASQEPQNTPCELQAAALGVSSSVSAPVFSQGALTAILHIASREPDLFTEQFKALIAILAQGVGRSLDTFAAAHEADESRRALGHSRRMLDKVYETLPMGVYIFDAKNRTIPFLTAGFERMFGMSAAEIQTEGPAFLTERFHPDDRHILDTDPVRFLALKDEEVSVVQNRLRVKSGDYRWFRTRQMVFERDADDNPRLILGSIEDFTEEVVARDTMAAALARARMLTQAVENAAESIIITDPASIIQYFNPAAERTSGYAAAEAVGRHTRILSSGRHDKAFYRHLWDTILRGEVWHGTFVNKRKDGILFEEEASIAPVKDESGRVTNFVAVKRDVSRERSLEDQLAQAQKLEAIGRLAGGVAHDFNNILTSILGYAQLAKEELPKDDPMRADLEEIEKGAARAADLTRQLLIFSRKQVVKARLIDPAAVVGALQKMLHRIIGEHYRLVFAAETSGKFINADPSQLEQIVMNFVVNSRDAMPRGGDIRVALKDARLDAPLSGLDGPIPPGDYASLTVTDAGSGIPPAVLKHIFEPFFTTKPAGQGTGLGLATVYGIVKQGGAYLTVESAEAKGTCMTVYWPYSTEVPEPEAAGAERDIGGAESILLVEDEGAVRRLTERLLTWAGYSVTPCSGPEEALAKAADSHILLLTDVVMPGMSGKTLAERLRARHPGLKVLYSSGYSDEIISKQGMLEPGARLLQKPFTKEALFKAVRETLDS
ncbi:MAG: PAS domain S-box protein [Elusimicrobia bacterium]|nr:PAS domain S-box protein [Elusimicrobiota bacterium]